jgi:hypothetical protein
MKLSSCYEIVQREIILFISSGRRKIYERKYVLHKTNFVVLYTARLKHLAYVSCIYQ